MFKVGNHHWEYKWQKYDIRGQTHTFLAPLLGHKTMKIFFLKCYKGEELKPIRCYENSDFFLFFIEGSYLNQHLSEVSS